jgi:hypothetical protein
MVGRPFWKKGHGVTGVKGATRQIGLTVHFSPCLAVDHDGVMGAGDEADERP